MRTGSLVFLLITACATAHAQSFGSATPEAEGMDSRPLVALTDSVARATDFPVLSILISRHGRLVYELYTSGLSREDAHYLMSVTKSVVSALFGIAIGEHLLPDPGTSIVDVLPADLFPSQTTRERFRKVTIQDVLGMSALDAPDPPRDRSPEAIERERMFQASRSRLRFALTQAVLPHPGVDFQYNDITPAIAAGLLQYATHMTALDFAVARLFGPMGFRNYEWMHQDPSSVDNGGYGLRLRPIDMQKLGVLYLRHGEWNGRQLVPREWVERSFTPWIRTPASSRPSYGWYWWTFDYGPGWTAHLAIGWKGQFIAVFPDQDLVVTMTAIIEGGGETAVFEKLIRKFVMPSVVGKGPLPARPALAAELRARLDAVDRGPPRIRPMTEWRMVPGRRPKEVRRPYAPVD